MKFKRNNIIFFILLACLIGPGVGANQENTSLDSSVNEVVRAGLFDGFLYFADTGKGVLKALPKRFASNLNSHELGRDILEALMEGPPNSVLAPTFPKDTQVRALFVSEDGKAWVDLGIRDGYLKNMDTVSELLAIYSLVNSLTLNIPGVKQVKILVNGSDVATLGGHVSLKYFYKTNMLIVK
ncbi:MAG: GerMN domain-containing protein [Desulfobacteraceae bacterium]|nr:GerMN domain-containing protein [Desulfobacteraceae bacterium]